MGIKYRERDISKKLSEFGLPNFDLNRKEKRKNTKLALSKKKEYDKFIRETFSEYEHKGFKIIVACRKGSCIIRSIPGYKISTELPSIEDGDKVLIFDDGIDTGTHVRNTLSDLMNYNLQEIVVVALRAKKSTLVYLEEQYPDIKFIVKEELEDVSYNRDKNFFKYLDSLGRVLDEDHMVVKFGTSEVIDEKLLREISNKINVELRNLDYLTSTKDTESLPRKENISKILKDIIIGRYSLRFQDISLWKEIESTKIFCGYQQVKIKVYIGKYSNSENRFKGYIKFFPIVIPHLDSSSVCPLLKNCDIRNFRKFCKGIINKDCLHYISFLIWQKLIELELPAILKELKQNNIEVELEYVADEIICRTFEEKGKKLVSRLEKKIKKM